MNFKKLSIIVFMLVMIVLTVKGAVALTPPSGGISYYDFSSVTDLWGSNDGTNNGATSTASYPSFNIGGDSSPNSFSFDGVNDYIEITNNNMPSDLPITYTAWIKTSQTTIGTILGSIETGERKGSILINEGKLIYYDSSGTGLESTINVNSNEWVFFSLTDDGTEIKLYINSVLDVTALSNGWDTGSFYWEIGRRHAGGGSWFFNGLIDEVMIFNRSLNSSEIGYLYDYGNIERPSNFTISAVDAWNSSSILSFNATINGTTYNTSNGTIMTDILQNATSLYNVTLIADGYVTRTYEDYNVSSNLAAGLIANDYNNDSSFNVTDAWTGSDIDFNLSVSSVNYSANTIDFVLSSTGYFSNTFNDYNFSISLNTTLNQSDIKFRVYEVITGDELDANITINSTTKGVNESFYLSEGNHTVTVSKTGYYNLTENITVTALDNRTINISGLYDILFSINTTDDWNGSAINNFNTTITYNTYAASNVTTSGVAEFGLLSRYLYNLTATSEGYIPQTFTSLNISTNLTINFTPANSLNISFFSESTGSLLSGTNITVELISETFSNNYSTSIGYLNLTNLTPENYTIRAGADGYVDRLYQQEVNDDSNSINLTLLVNTTGQEEVTITVIDSLQNNLVGATVKVLEFDTTTNTFKTISISETNFEGKLTEYFKINEEFYKFIVEYDGETVLTTERTYILSNTITLVVNLQQNSFDETFYLTALFGEITFNNVTNVATFTFTDGDNVATQGCLKAYSVDAVDGKTLVNTSCVSGFSGAVDMTLDNSTGLYELRGFITKAGTQYYIANRFVSFGDSIPDDREAMFWSIIFVGVLMSAFLWRIEAAVVITGVSVLLLSISQLITVDIVWGITIFIASLVVAIIINKVISK